MTTISPSRKLVTLINGLHGRAWRGTGSDFLICGSVRTRHPCGHARFISASLHRGLDGDKVTNVSSMAQRGDYEGDAQEPCALPIFSRRRNRIVSLIRGMYESRGQEDSTGKISLPTGVAFSRCSRLRPRPWIRPSPSVVLSTPFISASKRTPEVTLAPKMQWCVANPSAKGPACPADLLISLCKSGYGSGVTCPRMRSCGQGGSGRREFSGYPRRRPATSPGPTRLRRPPPGPCGLDLGQNGRCHQRSGRPCEQGRRVGRVPGSPAPCRLRQASGRRGEGSTRHGWRTVGLP